MEISNKQLKRPGYLLTIEKTMRTKGLLAFLSSEELQTLIALSTFVDASGTCKVSARALGQALNLSEGQAQKRLKRVCSINWQGRPLVIRKNSREKGKFLATTYQLMEAPGLKVIASSSTESAIQHADGKAKAINTKRDGSSDNGSKQDNQSHTQSNRNGSNTESMPQKAGTTRFREGTENLSKQKPSSESQTTNVPTITAQNTPYNKPCLTNNRCSGVDYKNNINNKHTSQEKNEIRKMLSNQGVSESIASDLLENYPSKIITKQITMLPFRQAREPAAILIKSIKEDWHAPALYLAKLKEEAEKKKKTEAEAREAERRRIQQKRIDEVKAELTKEEFQEIKRIARDRVSNQLRGVFRGKAPDTLVKVEVNSIIANKYLNHATNQRNKFNPKTDKKGK